MHAVHAWVAELCCAAEQKRAVPAPAGAAARQQRRQPCQDSAPACPARAEAAAQQHRPARALALRARADALEAEAATWSLLAHLHADRRPGFPGGAGGPRLAGCAAAPTAPQRVARLLAAAPDLNWCGACMPGWTPTLPPRFPVSLMSRLQSWDRLSPASTCRLGHAGLHGVRCLVQIPAPFAAPWHAHLRGRGALQGKSADLQRLRGRRLARVVAWLEHRAGEALDRAEAAAQRSGGSGARFARDEGVPLSTLRALGRPGAAGLVSELDPDAPTRCAGSA